MVKKKILLSAYACDPSKGSEPGNGWNWAIGLAKKGFEVHVLTTTRGKTQIENQLKELDILKISIVFHYIDHSKFWNKAYYWNFLLMYIAYWTWQRKIFKYSKEKWSDLSIDFVHHVTWGSLKIGSQLYKLGYPMLFGPVGGGQKTPLNYKEFLGDDYIKELLRNLFGPIVLKYNPLATGVLRKCQVLVTNRDTLEMVNTISNHRVDLIFDAAIKEIPENFEKKNHEGGLNLIWVGRIYGFKGLRLIIVALSKIDHNDLRKVKLTIVGDGPDRRKSELLVNKLKLNDNIKFVGMVPHVEVSKFFLLSDVFIYTSLRDSFPSQILEAQIMKLPVITLNLHGQELMVNKDTGIKCSVDNPSKTIEEIAKAIIFLLHNSNIRRAMGENAFLHAKKQTWESKINYVINTYYK
jgi:glycosyltransferase involved in cell wall biosynthesis